MRLKAAQSQAFHMTARQRHLLSRGTWPRANEVTLLTAISRRPDPETRLKQRYERNDAGVAGLQVEIWSSIKPIHELFHDWACSNHSISSAFFCTPMSEHCAGSVRTTDSQRECRGRSFSF
ncbi:hypothetical protein GW17_00012737 [Ensete ventricosum]|nr:hypothetical protein GW17_00012737 [Ensete ventricosum]